MGVYRLALPQPQLFSLRSPFFWSQAEPYRSQFLVQGAFSDAFLGRPPMYSPRVSWACRHLWVVRSRWGDPAPNGSIRHRNARTWAHGRLGRLWSHLWGAWLALVWVWVFLDLEEALENPLERLKEEKFSLKRMFKRKGRENILQVRALLNYQEVVIFLS